MSEEVLQERQLGIEEYLRLFNEGSSDYALVKGRAEQLKAIHLKTVRNADGMVYEDTTFVEKTGVTYTIRVKL